MTGVLPSLNGLRPNPDWAKLPLFDRSKWQRVRFGDLVENLNETERNPLTAGIERFIGLEHLEPGSLHVRTWGDVADGTTFTRLCRPGQVLFGKRRAYQRKVAIAEFDAVVSGDIYVFVPKNDRLLPGLLPFLCMSERFFQHAVGTSAGSLSPRTNWSSLANFEFDLPPLDQQRRIAEILWAVDEAVVRASDISLDFASFTDSAIGEALQQGTPARKASHANTSWSRQPLAEICELQTGHGFAASEWAQKGFPIIRIQNLNGSREFNYFAGEPLSEWLVEPGTLLFAWAGVRGVSFGPCIWQGPLGVLNQHIYRIVPNPGINKRWLYEILRFITRDIEKKAHGFKIELVHVRKADITGQAVPVPPSVEQKAIADYAESIDSAHSSVNQHTDALRNLYAHILNHVFRCMRL